MTARFVWDAADVTRLWHHTAVVHNPSEDCVLDADGDCRGLGWYLDEQGPFDSEAEARASENRA